MPLSDTAIRTAKPSAKPVRLFDSGGLYLEISPAGGKLWRFKYRFMGKEKRLALGAYPDVGLKSARERRDEARRLLAEGIDPGLHKKATKVAIASNAENTFEVVAREWWAKQSVAWSSSYANKVLRLLERDVFPWIGARPIANITAPEVLSVARRIESRGVIETAHLALRVGGQVFRYAVATGRTDRSPVGDLKGALPPVKTTHFAAITEPERVGELLRAIDAFSGTFVVLCALRLAPMLFVRPGELRHALWEEMDLEKGEWRYLVTKTNTLHLVPLATQAVQILKELYQLTGRRKFVFPGRDPSNPMSGATINAALRRMGYDTKTDITGHGFRAMARTILAEELHVRPEVIEHQLAHKVPDALGTAYNRTKFLKERKVMMQDWADYLVKLKSGAKMLFIASNAA